MREGSGKFKLFSAGVVLQARFSPDKISWVESAGALRQDVLRMNPKQFEYFQSLVNDKSQK